MEHVGEILIVNFNNRAINATNKIAHHVFAFTTNAFQDDVLGTFCY